MDYKPAILGFATGIVASILTYKICTLAKISNKEEKRKEISPNNYQDPQYLQLKN